MTEAEYTLAQDWAHISHALAALRDLVNCDGVTSVPTEEYEGVIETLHLWLDTIGDEIDKVITESHSPTAP